MMIDAPTHACPAMHVAFSSKCGPWAVHGIDPETYFASKGKMMRTVCYLPGKSCLSAITSMLLVAASMASPAASAQHRPHHGAKQWHGDIARFHGHDWQVWHGGHWTRGHHDGRFGWWWVVGPSWYFYAAPIYPYPSPWEPAEIIVAPMTATPPMPPAQFWYYCDAARNYYPYVAHCPGGWRPVAVAPGVTGPMPPASTDLLQQDW